MDIINELITDPSNRKVLTILKSARNGAVYGGRLRFAHALVVALMFRRDVPLTHKLRGAFRAAKQHASILVYFALIYKLIVQLNSTANHKLALYLQKSNLIHLVAGAVGGYIVYGQENGVFTGPVTHQITLYCSSRVLLAVGKMLAHFLSKRINTSHHKIENTSWAVYSTVTWGLVMYIYKRDSKWLQSSLRHSMVYIYDNEAWHDVKSFIMG